MPDIVLPNGETAVVPVKKIKAVHPTGSKMLVEILTDKELNPTSIELPEGASAGGEGPPQAIIVELGPVFPKDSGLSVGQRIYWEGKGMAIDDPRTKANRFRAILEVHNVRAIIEEEEECTL